MKQTQMELQQEAMDALSDLSTVMHKLKSYYPELYSEFNRTVAPYTIRMFDRDNWTQFSGEMNRLWNEVANNG